MIKFIQACGLLIVHYAFLVNERYAFLVRFEFPQPSSSRGMLAVNEAAYIVS